MPKFRERGGTVEAVRWTGFNVAEVAEFSGTPATIIEMCISSMSTMSTVQRLPLFTSRGVTVVTVSPGDWIIRDVAGQYYPCHQLLFAKMYEAVS